jgi:tRNA/rRNA methyltransferase
VALVFGNETVGLSNEEILHCQAAVTIPTNPEFSSLNLGSAVQVLCYECRMAAFAEKPPIGGQRRRSLHLRQPTMKSRGYTATSNRS